MKDLLYQPKQTMNFVRLCENSPSSSFGIQHAEAFFFALCCTLSRAFDVPVYWPILLFYFIVLFVLTMKKRIQHMITHKYIPVTRSKPKVQPKNPHGKEFEK
eukprot:NODE_1962_length_796_cov_75.092369_g1558_i0.p2 GENE.NODE_1962_length_796_cov_75.092369_g1558_i0~~NODE_1962_length_796_cov_75.092369_g1558_i0.p2  ORF type:complete len:102 (+),score=16.77 NODE_1962_length_796_cov_75.092369_g1558_i0:257-562(+)